MPDVRSKTGRDDNTRMSINQTHEVNYWTKQLKTTPDLLKRAVAAVGPMVEDVKKWLRSNK